VDACGGPAPQAWSDSECRFYGTYSTVLDISFRGRWPGSWGRALAVAVGLQWAAVRIIRAPARATAACVPKFNTKVSISRVPLVVIGNCEVVWGKYRPSAFKNY